MIILLCVLNTPKIIKWVVNKARGKESQRLGRKTRTMKEITQWLRRWAKSCSTLNHECHQLELSGLSDNLDSSGSV